MELMMLRPAVAIALRPVADDDQEFLFRVYASTREQERELFGWSIVDWDQFLRMQFDLQRVQYTRNCFNPSFTIILADGVSAGRMYLDRRREEIRIIDIALLPEHRRQGIGGLLIRTLLEEADEQGVPVSLHVERDNPVLTYYERLGFQKKELRSVYYFMERRPGASTSGRILR